MVFKIDVIFIIKSVSCRLFVIQYKIYLLEMSFKPLQFKYTVHYFGVLHDGALIGLRSLIGLVLAFGLAPFGDEKLRKRAIFVVLMY